MFGGMRIGIDGDRRSGLQGETHVAVTQVQPPRVGIDLKGRAVRGGRGVGVRRSSEYERGRPVRAARGEKRRRQMVQ